MAKNSWIEIQMGNCENLIMQEIGDKRCKRLSVAKTYWWALKSEENIDWRRINLAIIDRWSTSALEWIKVQAHSGNCWGDKHAANRKSAAIIGIV